MVSFRCVMVVKTILDRQGLHYGRVELGEVEIRDNITQQQRRILNDALIETGLELLDDKKSILVEQIKSAIIELVHYREEEIKVNHSEYLTQKLNNNYTYLSVIFTETTGTTIERYYLAHKIEKVKEYIIYDELSLTEISYRLHYSSVAHLSNQFKKMTGLTPSQFKLLKHKRRGLQGNTGS